MFGLKKTDIESIRNAVLQFPEIDEVVIFGSRALGNYKRASDVDICIKGAKITGDIVLQLKGVLEEECLVPYFFDVLHYEKITNTALIERIDREGIVLTLHDKK